MAKEKSTESTGTPTANAEKLKALQAAMEKIEKN